MEKTILLQEQCFVGDSVTQGCFYNTSRLEGQYFIYLQVRVLNWTHSTGNRQENENLDPKILGVEFIFWEVPR